MRCQAGQILRMTMMISKTICEKLFNIEAWFFIHRDYLKKRIVWNKVNYVKKRSDKCQSQ